MSRRWHRWALALGLPLAVLCAVVGSTLGLLGTEAGSRWVLARVPGLEVIGFSGRLAGQWQAEELRWSDASGLRVSVRAPHLEWRPSCLRRLSVCLGQLQARQLAIHSAPSTASENAQPFRLPELRLPLSLELRQVAIDEVRLDGAPLLSELRLAARWDETGLSLDGLQLTYAGLALDIQGTLAPAGDWPLRAQLKARLPEVEGQAWSLSGSLDGALAGTLNLKGRSTGYLEANLLAELQPLAEHLPARLTLTSAAFLPSPGLPASMTLEAMELHAEGDLSQGYRVRGQGRLPGSEGAVAVSLDGTATARGAEVKALSLVAAQGRELRLEGSLDWSEGLKGIARIDWQDFPWTSLYPQASVPTVVAKRLQAEARYADEGYQGTLKGEFTGPAGSFSLDTPFQGDLQSVQLPGLQLRAGKGALNGNLRLGFVNGIDWAAELELAALDPAYWIAALPGSLAGRLDSQGQWRDDQLDLVANASLGGRLRGQQARLQGQLKGQGTDWRAENLYASLGANHLNAEGSSAQRLAGRLALDAPRLDQLWPGLAGALKGELNLAGTLDQPQGQFKLSAQRLAWEHYHLQALSLAAALDAHQQGKLSAKGTGLAVGDTALGTFTAEAGGDARRHQVKLDLTGPRAHLELSTEGSWQRGAWKGRLNRGQVALGQQAWALQAPASLQRLADGRIELGAHCWRAGAASLCADDQRLAPDPRLRLRLRDFSMASLRPWMPEGMEWKAVANADLQLDLGGAGPRGSLGVDLSNGTLQVEQDAHVLDLPYDTLRLTSILAPRRVVSDLAFEGRALGRLQLRAIVDPLGAGKPLSGNFALEGLDLELLRPLVEQAQEVAGRLRGSGQLSGTLMAPRVEGAFSLAGGALSAPGLPISVRDATLDARMNGNRLHLEGGWRSGEQGSGRVSGDMDWAGPLQMAVALQASKLPVEVPPYAKVEAGADLRLSLQDQALALAGTVRIPRGAITVRQLPPSTVKVSQDAVVVGREGPTRSSSNLAMDIDVQVGEEKLTFSGFGLQSDIAGKLHIGNDLDTRGSLELRNGRYRAYGQRLTLRRARLFFAGAVGQPYLDVEAIRQTSDVIAGIRLSGSVQQPVSEVFAEPAMSQEQALSWLVLGRPLSTEGEDSNLLAQAALGLGLMGSSSTAGHLAQSLGIQDFQLDTEGSGDKTSVVASGNLTDRLTLRYGVGVFEPANTVALRYALTRRLFLEAASGLASSLDLFYKRDF